MKEVPTLTDAQVLSFYTAIKHGDDEHQRWLLEAILAWSEGRAIPAARSVSPSAAQWREVAEDLAYELDSIMVDIDAQPYVQVKVKPSQIAARHRYDELKRA